MFCINPDQAVFLELSKNATDAFAGCMHEVAQLVPVQIIIEIVFLVHTILSMEIVLFFAFSKFVHAVYRPLV